MDVVENGDDRTKKGGLTVERDREQTPPLVAAPRHLRRRPFHAEIPDELLVPGAEPFTDGHGQVHESFSVVEKEARPAEFPMEVAYRRKRRVALLCVIIVSLSVPGLLMALIFAG
ncbi:hypothetical protein [Arthrobacter oryzae]|uniref:Uncharacterized protein n=1 Tax=Arthrobacter oryzae TaxID=409290 RepID=A0A495ENX6_9MICC|nr:hypothetical protein [Arthrobacter oryzae]RKR18688.1 hypothetical protein C8D78_2889 [Arthrobacter oryzae]